MQTFFTTISVGTCDANEPNYVTGTAFQH